MASHSKAWIGVVGGGIGGLTAALALLRAGFDVQVYEQASGLREIGAGVQVSPNASRVLHGLGLAEPLAPDRRAPAGLAPAPLGRRADAAAHPARRPAGGGLRLPPYADASRRPPRGAGRRGARRAGPPRPSPDRAGRTRGQRRGAVRQRHPGRGRRARGRRRHPFARAPRPVGPGAAALHGLRRLPRAGGGRSSAAPRARGDRAGLDGAGPALRPLLRPSRGARELRRDRRPGHVDPRVSGPIAARSPTRSRRSTAGTRTSATSSGRPTRRSSGRCSTVSRWSVGPPGA